MKIFTDIQAWYWLTGIFLFFAAYTSTSIFIVRKKKNTSNPRQLLSLYMLLKIVKIFLFIAFLAVYIFTVQVETKRFILVSGVLYGLFLIIDTLYLTLVEKRLKKNEKK
ncbi:MAG: hypothetical protein LBS25_08020 [Candidatus Symbiothrix sp.]|jgi:small-conductance mechanosensitive channel|nr:hypothetical protein [Candidatus Symbiothrix sp.]